MFLRKLFEVVSDYVLSEDKTFTEADYTIAQKLIDNAQHEIAVFRNTDEHRKLMTLYGRISRHSRSDLVFIYSYGIHHRDFDEMSFSIGGHPTTTLLPILLSFHQAEKVDVFLQGLKLEIGLGKMLNPGLYRGQYHPTTVIGILGAAAITAKLLHLTHEQTMTTLGMTFSFAGGVRGNFGSHAKYLQVAHATQQGLLSAFYAQKGLTANIDLLEQSDTLRIFSGKQLRNSDVLSLRRHLSKHVPLEKEFLIKKYDVCGSFHSLIDVAQRDRDAFSESVGLIEKVILSMHPDRLKQKSIAFPKNAKEKRFSPHYLYAYSFLGNDPAAIASSDVVSGSVTGFMKKIKVYADATLGGWEYKTEILRRKET